MLGWIGWPVHGLFCALSTPKPNFALFQQFDIPSVRLSHRRGHCSFHTMLSEYNLNDPILRRIAQIVDEADIVQEVTLEPIAAGLDLLCHGLRRISTDDFAAIKHGQLIYEALYAQLASEAES
jgi:hypothetical protein